MKPTNHWIIVLLILLASLLSACGGGQIPVTGDKVAPVKLEKIEGTDFQRVILTEKAVERINVQTAIVSGNTVPYAAVIYDTEGKTWVYTSPAPLTFVREPIMVERIEGDQAILSQGLKEGTSVVTLGVSELYGAETGVSK